ncbi:putative bifunctional diguanylate cyclase/phosphodiesterase [Siccirubricoccus phaeus]|uniref:putative bifunctional diguanylate cyclase/phosphodiesterase n=1 Tax=Siccirubricoccus phaeus TaxID=2595053 RepID=UPI0011F0C8FF|nr:EAL domain-containing protein [Siccirubricoccus phaeus]
MAAGPGGTRPRASRFSRSRFQWVLIGATALLAISATHVSSLVHERQEALRKTSRYNLGWTAAQAGHEVSRLQAALGAFVLRRGDAEREDIEMWLDLIANRVAVLRAGEVGAFVRSDPEVSEIVASLARAAEAARPLLDQLDQPDVVLQLMRSFEPLNPSMARLASLAHGRGADLAREDSEELAELHWQFSRLLMGLIATSLLLAGLAAWRNRLLARANAEVGSLVESLSRTGESLAHANLQVQEAMLALRQQNTKLRARDAELRRQNQLFHAALSNMPQGLAMFDAAHRLIVCNSRLEEMFRLPHDIAAPGVLAADILRHAGVAGGFGARAIEAVWTEHRMLAAEAKAATFVREDDQGRSLWVSHRPLADGGWVATYEDVTESRRAEARIRYLANHDALTDLPNRRHFGEQLQEALLAHDDGRQDVALLLIDLDNFKNVNDTLGHQAGDQLLRSAATRIKAHLREEEVVARLGGDEFAVLAVGEVARANGVEALARRITEALATPFSLGRYQASVAASIGIAMATGPGLNADVMMKHADVALYRAKAAGRGTHRIFEHSMAAELQSKMELEADLRHALERRELELHYQPVYNIARGKLCGFEALLRWQHPVRGLVHPSEFIPLAEETGLIVQFGEWVLRQACLDAANIPADIKIAVNVSAAQFAGGDLLQVTGRALTEAGLAPHRLELEVTESVLLQDSDAVVATFHRLRTLGVGISLDDFGTKYSSLSYLRNFPLDKIKIDQSFVRDMAIREDCRAIVRSIARLATSLGMVATAEGVESAAQLEQVREAGCAEAQGYFYGRAAPIATLGHLFAGRPSLVLVDQTAAGRRA